MIVFFGVYFLYLFCFSQVGILVKFPTEPNVSLNAQGNSVLHMAAKRGAVQIAERILRLHPSLLYRTNSKGDTPLHVAAWLGRLEMTRVLINRARMEVEVGRNHKLLRMGNLEKDTTLHDVVRNGHFDIDELLIREHPRLTSLTNNAGESALFLAVDRAFYKIALHILEEEQLTFQDAHMVEEIK